MQVTRCSKYVDNSNVVDPAGWIAQGAAPDFVLLIIMFRDLLSFNILIFMDSI